MREEEIKNVVDIKGQKIQIGDVVLKAKFSKLSIHKVLRITKKSIVISIFRDFRYYGREPNLRTHYFIKETITLDSLREHNNTMYVPIRHAQFNLIKY